MSSLQSVPDVALLMKKRDPYRIVAYLKEFVYEGGFSTWAMEKVIKKHYNEKKKKK